MEQKTSKELFFPPKTKKVSIYRDLFYIEFLGLLFLNFNRVYLQTQNKNA